MPENKIAVFQGKQIRKVLLNNAWWFSIIDVVAVLTDRNVPKRYWSDLKKKLFKEGYSEAYEKIAQLKLPSDSACRKVCSLIDNKEMGNKSE